MYYKGLKRGGDCCPSHLLGGSVDDCFHNLLAVLLELAQLGKDVFDKRRQNIAFLFSLSEHHKHSLNVI